MDIFEYATTYSCRRRRFIAIYIRRKITLTFWMTARRRLVRSRPVYKTHSLSSPYVCTAVWQPFRITQIQTEILFHKYDTENYKTKPYNVAFAIRITTLVQQQQFNAVVTFLYIDRFNSFSGARFKLNHLI